MKHTHLHCTVKGGFKGFSRLTISVFLPVPIGCASTLHASFPLSLINLAEIISTMQKNRQHGWSYKIYPICFGTDNNILAVMSWRSIHLIIVMLRAAMIGKEEPQLHTHHRLQIFLFRIHGNYDTIFQSWWSIGVTHRAILQIRTQYQKMWLLKNYKKSMIIATRAQEN